MAFAWANEVVISHRSFRIVDVAGDDDLIRDKTFEDCTIYGPAVVIPMGSGGFEGCTFEAAPGALFWELSPDRELIVGAIGLDNCTFRRCVFRRIGIAGTKELIDRFVQSGMGQDPPTR